MEEVSVEYATFPECDAHMLSSPRNGASTGNS